jgi:PAS domain S-box-containing protein
MGHETRDIAADITAHAGVSVCPTTGLPITRDPAWTRQSLGFPDFSMTVVGVGSNILLVRLEGASNYESATRGRALVEEAVARVVPEGRQYVLVEDYAGHTGATIRAKNYYIGYQRRNSRLRGIVFCNASNLFRVIIKMGTRIGRPPFPVVIAEDQADALARAQALLQDVCATAPLDDHVAQALAVGRCPVTGLTLRSWPEWTGMALPGDYRVSFHLLGDGIVLSVPEGVCSPESMEGFLAAHRRFIEGVGLAGTRYAEIKDCRGMQTLAPRARQEFISRLGADGTAPRAGFWGFGLPDAARMAMVFDREEQASPAIKVRLVEDYATAVREAVASLAVGAPRTGAIPCGAETDPGLARDIEDLMAYMGGLNWESQGMIPLPRSMAADHPFRPLYDTLGMVKYDFDAIMREHQSAEQRLRLTQRSVDSAADPIFWVAPDASIVYVNRSACSLLGYTRAMLLGLPLHQITPEMPAESWALFWEDVTERTAFTYETDCARKDGSTFPVEVTVNHLVHEEMELVCLFMHDITTRKWAEQYIVQQSRYARLRADVWKLASDMFMAEEDLIGRLLERVGPVMGMSRAAYFRVEREADPRERLRCIHEWTNHGVEPLRPQHLPDDVLSDVVDGGKYLTVASAETDGAIDRFIGEHGIRAMAALPYYVFGRVEGLFLFQVLDAERTDAEVAESLSHGILDEAVGIISNSATQKRAQDELRRAHDQLEELVRYKDMFISRLGHDLKTPLTPLVTLLPMVKARSQDAKSREMLDVMLLNVNNMKELVIKTLKLARLTSASARPKTEEMALRPAVESYVAKRAFIIQRAGLAADVDVPGGLTLRADPLDLEELYYNLISNAVKHTPEGGRITLGAEPAPSRDTATAWVRDTGVGLLPGQMERIFDEFYKADESRHELDSSGLGLAICRRIVERYGGRIWAVSPGKGLGTTILFTLPMAPEGNGQGE